ncbi:MAG: lamin tail domain-containing protein, partial [Cyclobacteriaceae bacterium]|nr:lamin tail domain-containing protein [Cyclobacteriaceae bacterium]
NDSTLVLTFENALVEGKDYKLKAGKIPDLEGNILQDTSVVFQFFDPTAYTYKSLVINELMPAPRADQDLPNSEYVELFNPNQKEYRLDLLKLANSRNETSLSEAWMEPGEFLILVPKGQENNFSGFGKVLGVANWPTLLNSGDLVTIKSQEGTILDQIAFSTGTWGGSEYSGGGFSLEVPNPDFLCENSSFLKPSQDPMRGTPGRINSVFNMNIDLDPVELKRAYFLDSISFMVELVGVFSGSIYPDQIVLSPDLLVEKVEKISSEAYRISLKSPVVPNQVFQLSLNGLADCRGQDLGTIGPVPLVLAAIPQPGEIHLTEILFDPISGDPKFVEIHNSSSNFLNLKSWALGNLNDQGQISQIRIFGTEGTLIPPKGFLAISTDPEKLKARYPKSWEGNFLQVSALPSYPISGGTVVLLRNEKDLVEKFSYSSKFHHPLIQNSKGVSL